MPTRCTEAATCSGIRNSWLAVHMQANRIGRIVRLGLSRRRRQNVAIVRIAKAGMRIRASFGLCAAQHTVRARIASSVPAPAASDRKQTGPFVPSPFTFARGAVRVLQSFGVPPRAQYRFFRPP
jgi:hypothetical protein